MQAYMPATGTLPLRGNAPPTVQVKQTEAMHLHYCLQHLALARRDRDSPRVRHSFQIQLLVLQTSSLLGCSALPAIEIDVDLG